MAPLHKTETHVPTASIELQKKQSQWWRPSAGFRIMGLEPSPELLAISMVYFVQGILGLSRLAIQFFFKDDLHVEPAEVALLTGLSSLPWMIKPLYGFITDSIPLFGYRRRSYLVACGLLGTCSWSVLAFWVDTPSGTVAAMMCASLATAFSDVVVDSIVVERARGAPQATSGSLQSLCWGSAAVGGIASAYFSGSLVEDYGTRFVFSITALFPLVVSCAALLIDEKPVKFSAAAAAAAPGVIPLSTSSAGGLKKQYTALDVSDDLDNSPNFARSSVASAELLSTSSTLQQRLLHQGRGLWQAISRKDILLPTIFVFLWQATPTADTAMFYYQTNRLGFSPDFLGRIRFAGSIASLAGIAVYNLYLKKVPLKRMLFWCMILGTILSSTTLILVSGLSKKWGISDQTFVLGDSVILTVLGQVSFMPILVLAARMCPEGVEATLFATLMSVLNGGASVGSALGAGITAALGVTSEDFHQLFTLVAICTVATLMPAPFLKLLPDELEHDPEGLEGQNSTRDKQLPGGIERSIASKKDDGESDQNSSFLRVRNSAAQSLLGGAETKSGRRTLEEGDIEKTKS
ncbi:hypothetical protein CEUSTIGMA_g4810.t1 [Chlamydomonas eustigma]|uniref:Major facilitator superfamily (MFS) profile domain-containing protein n=1 Tax=Chlamydomonas eustigma TaxID=1157962 RepID=A0A250X2P5_9CHLO|nr:hypothetical protein CEUSTIGMA_g4810.t1 [Chlamydomonas eustigma]|eukprot:GAX77364.1 hypothetical protein CEUSTIGMA_g4810.t1 [Chlamydomonas eustigma]